VFPAPAVLAPASLAAALLAVDQAAAQLPVGPVAPTREDLEQQLAPGIAPRQPVDELGTDEGRPAPRTMPDEGAAHSFVLRGLDIANATVYADDDFRELYESFLGAEVALGS